MEHPEILRQLEEAVECPGAVIFCTGIGAGDDPYMRLILPDSTWYGFMPNNLAGFAEQILRHAGDIGISIVCSLRVEGNGPPDGETWTPLQWRNGAVIGMTSCILTLMRHEQLRSQLSLHPDQVRLFLIENGRLVHLETRGGRIVRFLDGQLSS